MKTAVVFLADGFEETEAVVPVDILRRAGVEVSVLSITGSLDVAGSHDIRVTADGLISGSTGADMLILPGGPGAAAYIDCRLLCDMLINQNKRGGYIAAICAAPVTLGKLGLLNDKAATCYPGVRNELIAKTYADEAVVTDGNIITARAAGAAAQFGLVLTGILTGLEEQQRVKNAMCY